MHDMSINILWQVIIPYDEPYQPAMGPRWVSTTFWLCRAVCGSDHGGKSSGSRGDQGANKMPYQVGEEIAGAKNQENLMFLFYKKIFGADEIDIDWYEIHIWWGYTPWDPRGGCFCVFNLSSTFQRLEPNTWVRKPPSVGLPGNGCDASRGSDEASFESSSQTEAPIIHNHSKLTVFHGIPDKEDFSRFFFWVFVIPFVKAVANSVIHTVFPACHIKTDADFGLRQGSKRSNHAAGFVLAAEWETQKKSMEKKGSDTTSKTSRILDAAWCNYSDFFSPQSSLCWRCESWY